MISNSMEINKVFSLLRPRILEEEFQGISCRIWRHGHSQKIDMMSLGSVDKSFKSHFFVGDQWLMISNDD